MSLLDGIMVGECMAMPPILLRVCAPRYWTAWATWISIWPQIKMEKFLCLHKGMMCILWPSPEKAISKMDCYNSSYVNDLMAKPFETIWQHFYLCIFNTSVSISIHLLNHYQIFEYFVKS